MSGSNLVFIIEDEIDIAELLRFNLEQAGYRCIILSSGKNAVREVQKKMPQLILLDLMLPEVDGIEICKRLKRDPATSSIPILMITAKGTEHDRILGLELGADDYIVKPFSPREVVLRVNAVMSRTYDRKEVPDKQHIFRFGSIELDAEKHEVTVDGETVDLTATEFKLLYELISNPGTVQTRDKLLDKVWGYSFEGYARTVDTHIRRLRKKLKNSARHIETVRGVGYRFRDGK